MGAIDAIRERRSAASSFLTPLLAAVAAFALVPAPAVAQWSDILTLQAGDSVRLRLPGALRVDASMGELRRDTLLLTVEGLEGPWPVSGYDLLSLERYGDRTPQEGLRYGAVIGLVSGVFAGAAVGILFNAVGSGGDGEPSVEMLRASLKGAGLGAALGAVGGGIVGGRKPGRGWVAMAVPRR